jgi:colicin import membrane protein
MARALKTYVTSVGFFELAVAAPSRAAALRAWGAERNLFEQGFAKETEDRAIIAAAMKQPGVVLRRAVGGVGAFSEHAALPKSLPAEPPPRVAKTKGAAKKAALKPSHAAGTKLDKADVAAKRKAEAAFEKAQKAREAERAKEEAAAKKEQAKREAAIAKAEAALDTAREHHQAALDAIERDRAAIEKRIEAEEDRWQGEKDRLRDAVDRARSA